MGYGQKKIGPRAVGQNDDNGYGDNEYDDDDDAHSDNDSNYTDTDYSHDDSNHNMYDNEDDDNNGEHDNECEYYVSCRELFGHIFLN